MRNRLLIVELRQNKKTLHKEYATIAKDEDVGSLVSEWLSKKEMDGNSSIRIEFLNVSLKKEV